jgi:FMN phosphatase YigB (HAD superfamily)
LRKPEKDSYLRVIEELKVAPSEIIFVDDRLVNVTAAIECGIDGIHFTSSTNLVEELRKRGLEVDRSSVV